MLLKNFLRMVKVVTSYVMYIVNFLELKKKKN